MAKCMVNMVDIVVVGYLQLSDIRLIVVIDDIGLDDGEAMVDIDLIDKELTIIHEIFR